MDPGKKSVSCTGNTCPAPRSSTSSSQGKCSAPPVSQTGVSRPQPRK